MMIRSFGGGLVAMLLVAAGSSAAQEGPARGSGKVVVRNDSDLARRGEVVQVDLAALGPGLNSGDLASIRVADETGQDVLVQPVDLTGDHDDDAVAFRVDVAPRSASTYRFSLGAKRTFEKKDFRVYGRFVRERFDDFAWENDKVAFRMYGEALETWVKEPLTSSSVDAWVKRTTRLTVDDWYLVDDYHKDHGEGGDFYSAGKTRGCGGTGLLSGGRLFTSKNFRRSRVLSRGPIRLIFELDYDAWDVAGTPVRETKRVTLDAGSNFSRFESRYATASGEPLPGTVLLAAGTKKEKGADVRVDTARGAVRTWEELNRYGKDGWMGCAVVVDPARVDSTPELDGNVLLAFRAPAVHYAGTGWDRSGDFKTMADFDAHVNDFASRLASPLKVEVIR